MDFIAAKLGGSFAKTPEEEEPSLSKEALELLKECFADIEKPILDVHTHLAGIGSGNTGCEVHSHIHSPFFHPMRNLKFRTFMSGSGVNDRSNADKEYLERLVLLWYDLEGKTDPHKTGLYIPNDYVASVVKQYPELFELCVSVHPYRKDALDELDKWGNLGVKLLKWLPNSMGIDPKRCDPFYERMKKWGIILLTHTGKEHSIDPPGLDQNLGNPLHLRRPLDKGIKVIAAHCASEGENIDLDDPQRPTISNFKLFMRLMDDPKYKDLLYADISAITGWRRLGEPLTTILDRTDLHPRLVFGTDYPVPAVALVVLTKPLVKQGYITARERPILNEIYQCNPLLYDFAVKRVIRSPISGSKLSTSIFSQNENLFGPQSSAKVEMDESGKDLNDKSGKKIN